MIMDVEFDHATIGHPRRTPAALDAAILEQLAAGPLMKWQLREALHEPESYLLKRLKTLKAAGQIKVVGKMLDKRAWALTTWTAPMPPGQRMSLGRPPAPKPSTSWWIGTSREEFAASVKARQRGLFAPENEGDVHRRLTAGAERGEV